jgi:hypothetical protein
VHIGPGVGEGAIVVTGVGDAVGTGVREGANVGVGVTMGANVGVGVGEGVGAGVGDAVAVAAGVGDAVAVAAGVGDARTAAVIDGVGEAELVPQPTTIRTRQNASDPIRTPPLRRRPAVRAIVIVVLEMAGAIPSAALATLPGLDCPRTRADPSGQVRLAQPRTEARVTDSRPGARPRCTPGELWRRGYVSSTACRAAPAEPW